MKAEEWPFIAIRVAPIYTNSFSFLCCVVLNKNNVFVDVLFISCVLSRLIIFTALDDCHFREIPMGQFPM